MQPLEYQKIIDMLNQILTEPYFSHLAYDPSDPRNGKIEKLVLQVTSDTSDYVQVTADANRIGSRLKETTGRSYKAYAAVGDGTSPRFVTLHEEKEKKAVNPDTDQQHPVEMPASEVVRQAILDLEYPDDGVSVKDASITLAQKFELSEEQKSARNSSNLNMFRYDLVARQFKNLLREGKLKQPKGPRTRYFLAGSSSDSSDTVLRENSREYEGTSAVEKVERTALKPDGEGYQIELPATHIVKQALLDFDYPASGIEIKDVAEALADQFTLTDEDKNATGNYGLVWRRHINIAANALVNSGKLLRLRQGWIVNSEQPDVEVSDPDVDPLFSDGDIPSPEVVIEQNYQEHQDRLKKELLQKIMDNPPDFFEELVLDLFVKMGYGGSRMDAEAVGRSRDSGIDGIIKEDRFGLDVIYVQAKRGRTGVIGRPDILNFAEALQGQRARKGIFITTSNFSKEAKKYVQTIDPKIELIDGEQLAELMIEHNVGVSTMQTYEIKQVNNSYFIEDTE